MTAGLRSGGIRAWQVANRLLRPYGRELIRASGARATSYRIQKILLPPRFRSRDRRPDNQTFLVEIDKVTTDCGFSFAPDGWHPFVATLREYLADPELQARKSTLHRLHQTFQPATVQELLLEDAAVPLEPLHRWPPIRRLFRRVWALTPWVAERELRAASPLKMKHWKWLYFGPTTEQFVEFEFDRLIGVFESIRRQGYQEALDRQSRVNGYFLCRGDDYRFVVLNGNHRVAALRLLGIREVPVEIRAGHPTVVHYDLLPQWSKPRGGLYPLEVAYQLFHKMYNEDGYQKAITLGLVHPVNPRSLQESGSRHGPLA